MDIKKNSKRHPIIIRLDSDERARLERLAAFWGVKLAIAVRRLIREAVTSEDK